MGQSIKKYVKDDVTIVWQPDKCIHSKLCWTGLREVFNPRARPWVNIEGADKERILEQVAKCPSGALSYIFNSENSMEQESSEKQGISVEAIKNGPLMVYGDLRVKDKDGNEVNKTKATAFCRCGASSNKPYCDGSHRKVGFSDE